jgi:hypothetical protein
MKQRTDSVCLEMDKSSLGSDLTQALHNCDSVAVFTQYADTMDYDRERLVAPGSTKIG